MDFVKTVENNLVFHVAHPTIPAILIEGEGLNLDSPASVGVFFLQKVEFSMNSIRGASHVWSCSRNLLYKTAEEALKAHNPNHNSGLKREET